MGNQQVNLGELYQISAVGVDYYHDGNGNIYSTRRGKLKKLKLIPTHGRTKKTYYRVKIQDRLWMVHRLVCIEKYGRLLEKHETVNHINADTEDNRPENLEIASHRDQVDHAMRMNLYCSGEDWYIARGMSPR